VFDGPNNLRTNSMELSPSGEANRFSASREIPRILWNPKVHYSTRNSPPPVSILSQIETVRACRVHFLTHFSINLHLRQRLPCSLFPSSCPTKTLYATSPLPCTCYVLSDLIACMLFGVARKSHNTSLSSLFHLLVSSSHSGPNIFLGTNFSNTLSLQSSPNVRD
jgi:hypothetical protein